MMGPKTSNELVLLLLLVSHCKILEVFNTRNKHGSLVASNIRLHYHQWFLSTSETQAIVFICLISSKRKVSVHSTMWSLRSLQNSC